jgi:hypothetical protein
LCFKTKTFSFKAQTNLAKSINQRAYLNVSWISNRPAETYMNELAKERFAIVHPVALKKPDNETQALKFSLESFEISDQQESILMSVRLIESNLARK